MRWCVLQQLILVFSHSPSHRYVAFSMQSTYNGHSISMGGGGGGGPGGGGTFYDLFNLLVDCSDQGNIHLAYHQTTLLGNTGHACYAYDTQIPLDQLMTVLGVNAHTDLNAKMFVYLFATFNAGIVCAWLSIMLAFFGVLGSPFLQISGCECDTCTGKSAEPAKKKDNGDGNTGAEGGPKNDTAAGLATGAVQITLN